jgi:hypothetical protein
MRWAAIVAVVLGIVLWWRFFGSAPRYSDVNEDNGDASFFLWMIATAFVIGFFARDRAGVCGVALGVPPLVLAPWTAPRGDGDGLWTLIIPILFLFIFVVVGASAAAGRLRDRLTG